MKALVVIFLFFTFMGIGYALVTSRHISDDEFADWSIQDEQAVSNLPVCVK